jgi:hypothetical protein
MINHSKTFSAIKTNTIFLRVFKKFDPFYKSYQKYVCVKKFSVEIRAKCFWPDKINEEIKKIIMKIVFCYK